MKEIIMKCGWPGCKNAGAETCTFHLDHRMDLPGITDNIYEHIDLCSVHRFQAYKLAENLLSFEQRAVVVDHIRRGHTRIRNLT